MGVGASAKAAKSTSTPATPPGPAAAAPLPSPVGTSGQASGTAASSTASATAIPALAKAEAEAAEAASPAHGQFDIVDTFSERAEESSPPRHALPERMEAELPAPKEVEAAEVPKALTATGEELVKAIEAEDWCSAEKILTERPEDCDVNARTSDWNYCLLRAAAEEGASETCRKLLEHQADVNARDQNNMTALMGCIVGGDYHDIVRMLLEARADGAAVTDDGFTALKWATRLNRKESVELLRSVGMRGEASAFS
ncbi:Ankycorbin (Ankyrin repeat and coiled-coil structure-containing protein) (Novel retinal pigment epithelial cell protein) (Retinoic acid-induced protein 14) (p125) [Durusdinium trenchii]|uniref:Ankycorbin (Ankyrin repeat and coiled-coil structure-containing protein) (Novel retinal pigment epithelial cell protein) (Retinoic acid-induced protein 14) (p125) n=1 Tax=Durusdinium trenchii TaxID=1381693 RepID=A0ABP0SFV4_9DINO